MLKKVNLNGTVYENADRCKLFNLSAQQVHALDVYVMTSNIDAQNWLLSRNSDNSAKISLEIDRKIKGHGINTVIFPGQVVDIAAGNPGESFSNPFVFKRATRIDHITYNKGWNNWTESTFWDVDNMTNYYYSDPYWYSGFSSQQTFVIKPDLTPALSTDRMKKIRVASSLSSFYLTLIFNGTDSLALGEVTSMQKVVIPSQPENSILTGVGISATTWVAGFNIYQIDFYEKTVDQYFLLDDNSHVQMLPSHNLLAQEPVRLLGGTSSTNVGELWGRARASLPNEQLVPPGYFEDRSEWYANMGTRDDSLELKVIVNPSTNQAEADLYMQDVVIIVQPSQHEKLRKPYFYYDTDNEPPRIEKTGVVY